MLTINFLKKWYNYRFLLMISILLITIFAKSKKEYFGSIGGVVIDYRTRMPISNALVSLKSIKNSDSTDTEGKFEFEKIPVGYYDFEVLAKGYKTQYYPSIQIKSGINKNIEIELKKDDEIEELDKVVVSTKRVITKNAQQTNSVIKFTREDVLNSPGSLQDVNRVVQLMPSAVSGADNMFNEFLVRGGNSDENIFLIDGIEVFNLSHWGTQYGSAGAISILHSDFIKNLDFYAGGVPVKFPPRLSSVVDIHFRDGSMTNHSYQVDLNMAGVGVFLEGPIVKNRCSYMVNARISFLDLMEPFLDLSGMPKYQNGQLKLVWNVNTDNKLIGNLILGHETINIYEEEDLEKIKDEGKHLTGGLIWKHQKDWGINNLIFTGKYNSFIESGIREDSICFWKWETISNSFQIKNDLDLFIRDKDILNLGFVAENNNIKDIIGNDEYYVFVDSDSTYHTYLHKPDSQRILVGRVIDSVKGKDFRAEKTGYRIGAHLGYTLFINRLKFNFGLRNDYYSLSKKHGLSPRGAISLDLNNIGTFSISGGLYYQFPSYIHLVEGDTKLWDLELQRNIQTVLGYEKQLSDVHVLGTEAYYKHYDKEPIYSIDDLGNGVGVRNVDVDTKRNGKKQTYGIEAYIHKKKQDQFFYQLSYSLYSAKRKYENRKWYNADNNLRNSVKLILGSNFHKSHCAMFRFDLTEGYPYTKIDKEISNVQHVTLYDIRDGWNKSRRKLRTKLSFRYNLTFYRKWGNITSYVEIQNILNQKDVFYEYYSLGEKYPNGNIKKILSRGIFPVGGMTIDF